MAPPPPATAVGDAMTPLPVPRDSRANIDIMAVTKGFHWPWFAALVLVLIGVAQAAFTLAYQTYWASALPAIRRRCSGVCTSSPSCSGLVLGTRGP